MNEQVAEATETPVQIAQPVKKVALATRRSKEEKLKKDEEELNQLIAEHNQVTEEKAKDVYKGGGKYGGFKKGGLMKRNYP